MKFNVIIVRYGEIFLKSRFVQNEMIKLLINNIKKSLHHTGVAFKIRKERGRIFIETKEIKKASERLKKIFGIVSFSPAVKIKLSKVENFFKRYATGLVKPTENFCVRVKRVGNHTFTSKEMEERLGDIIRCKTQAKVNLTKPDKKIFVEIREDDVYVYTEVIKGPGGLPVGVSGKVLVLLSGGIDSPVAAWYMAKRGCKLIFVNFKLGKFGGEKEEKIIKILRRLNQWYPFRIKIYFVDYEKVLAKLTKVGNYTCVLCKRMMLRIASTIAKKEKYLGIITGDSLGEVASQTLENLKIESEASYLPVFRPLIGMDKEEIVKKAKEIKTYDISISNTVTCKAVPKKPKTKAKKKYVEKIEKGIDVTELTKETLKNIKTVIINDRNV